MIMRGRQSKCTLSMLGCLFAPLMFFLAGVLSVLFGLWVALRPWLLYFTGCGLIGCELIVCMFIGCGFIGCGVIDCGFIDCGFIVWGLIDCGLVGFGNKEIQKMRFG